MSALSQLALNEEGFVFDPTTGDSYQANETALSIIKAIRNGISDTEVASTLADTHGVSVEDVWADITDLRRRLAQFGWV